MRLLSPSRRTFVETEPDCVEDPFAVAADGARELDERLQAGTAGPGEPGVEVRRGERGVLEVIEKAELFFEQERAVERPVGLLDFPELGQLVDRLPLRRFQ